MANCLQVIKEGLYVERVIDKGVEKARWEDRWKDLDAAEAPYGDNNYNKPSY